MSGPARFPRLFRTTVLLPLLTTLVWACGDDGADPNQPPDTPSIVSPTTGATFGIGEEIQFQGTAMDPEDGNLTGSSLVWASSLDGQIGTGTSVTRSDLSEGEHDITLTATDSEGEDRSATVTITVANQPPETPVITSPTDEAEFGIGQEVTFEGSATDPEEGDLTGESLVWTSDVDEEIGTGTSFTVDDLSEGTHEITLTATDADDQSSSATVTITIQNQAPATPTISAPEDGAVVAEGTSVTFEGSATDPEEGPLTGGSLVWESDLEGEIGTGTSFDTDALSLGDHEITLTAMDSEGRTSSASIDVSVQAAPTVSIDAPADGTTVTSGDEVTLEGTATDAEDGDLTGESLLWSSDLDGELGTGASLTVDDLSVGTHTITLTATDAAGLTGEASITLVVESSDQDPTVSITDPDEGDEFAGGTSIQFAATATDPQDGALTGASLVWTSDVDGQIGTGTSFSTSALSVGTHTVTVTATDSDGRSASDGVTIEVLAPPTAAITAPADGATFEAGADVDFEGSGTDPDDGELTGGSLVWTSNLDGEIGTGESFTVNDLSWGTHTVTLTATDSDGLSGTDQISVTINPPGSAPTANITSPADGATFDEGDEVTFEGTGDDDDDGPLTGASLVWSSNQDGQIGTGTSVSTTDLSAGSHTITLTATDSDGRTGTDQIGITVNTTGSPIMVEVGASTSTTINVGEETTIPIIVDLSSAGGRDVASVTLELGWQSGTASYVSYTQVASGSEFVTQSGGTLSYTWFDTTGTSSTFTLFEITLEGAASGSTTITVDIETVGQEDGTDITADAAGRDHTLTVN